ncbi:hypothetical protein ACVWZ8_000904 [Arthrobacter sp. UYCu723]
MPTSGTTQRGTGILASRAASARPAAKLCPYMFTAVLNTHKLFRRKPVRMSSMNYNNEAPVKGS